MEMNLARNGLTPAGHVSFSDLTGQVGTDGDGLLILRFDWTAHVSFNCWDFNVSWAGSAGPCS